MFKSLRYKSIISVILKKPKNNDARSVLNEGGGCRMNATIIVMVFLFKIKFSTGPVSASYCPRKCLMWGICKRLQQPLFVALTWTLLLCFNDKLLFKIFWRNFESVSPLISIWNGPVQCGPHTHKKKCCPPPLPGPPTHTKMPKCPPPRVAQLTE